MSYSPTWKGASCSYQRGQPLVSRSVEIEFEALSERIDITVEAKNLSQKQIECIQTLETFSELAKCGNELQKMNVSIDSQFAPIIKKQISAVLKVIITYMYSCL